MLRRVLIFSIILLLGFIVYEHKYSSEATTLASSQTAIAMRAETEPITPTIFSDGITEPQHLARTKIATEGWIPQTYVSHGLGGINEDRVTNTMDAFKENYEKGFRQFEVDLSFTSDGVLVGMHDWGEYGSIPTYAAFKESKVKGKYTPTSLNDILDLMETYPDFYLITDTKETDPEIVKNQFKQIVETVEKRNPALIERIIPEIYNPQMYDIVMSIHPFTNYIYSLYLLNVPVEEIEDFIVKHQVKVVGIDEWHQEPNFLQFLNDQHIFTYDYTVNDWNEINRLKSLGVDGFYTDFLNPFQTE